MPAGEWYYRHDGKPHGPFNAAQFEKLIRGKAVTLDTEVSTDGLVWHTLRETLAGAPSGESPEYNETPTLIPGEVRLPPSCRTARNPVPPS